MDKGEGKGFRLLRRAFAYWPPAWLAFLNYHWNRYHQSTATRGRSAWRSWELLFFLLPFGFYVAQGLRWVRQRLITHGRASRSLPLLAHDDGNSESENCPHCSSPCVDALVLKPDYPYRFAVDVLRPLARGYFRAEFHGLEKIPDDGPTLIYMNHAGMAFPWDFLVLGGELTARRGEGFWLRGPGEKVFTRNPIFNYILPARWLETVGGVEATFANMEKLFRHQHVMLYAPEGAAGMAKGWHRRYQLERFHTSFLKLAAKYNAKLVPAVCLGGEALHPLSVNVPWLAKLLGFPFFGISPFVPFLLSFPSLLIWSLPTKLRYYVFDPIGLPKDNYERYTDADWQALAERFRQDLQQKLDRLLQRAPNF